jgi:alkaline phosphatase
MRSRDVLWLKRLALVLAALALFVQPARAAKNVILMVADGAGFNTWIATSMYQGKLFVQVYDAEGWVKLACCTYPLSQSTKPKGNDTQDPALVYDPAKVWATPIQLDTTIKKDSDTEDADATPAPAPAAKTFAGYVYQKASYTDSAAAATAMATGKKTYNNAINWSNRNQPLRGKTIAEMAKSAGKSVGVVTTVPWSHATPAALGGAHNVTRNDYVGIAKEMLNVPYLDVIMGAGHPDFNDDGAPRAKKQEYKYVGGPATWQQLTSGTHPAGWKLVESKADFEALAAGPTPCKVLGTAQVATTLQQCRGKAAAAAKSAKEAAAGKAADKPAAKAAEKPFSRPFNRNVPTLAVISRAAINCLDKNPEGFYLMIEGGAVDWANHANQSGRMIEEQVDFLKAVEAVVDWVEKNSSWDDTLLILTADHETGLIWGPNSDKVAFEPLVDRGAGNVPGMKYNATRHSNSLVPLLARGAGSERFAALVVGTDKTAAAKYGISGQYVDNTGIFTVMKAAVIAPRAVKRVPAMTH